MTGGSSSFHLGAMRPVAIAALGGCFLLIAAALLRHLGTSLIEADEAAHYVNALMIGDWIAAGLPAPLGYAQDYYSHFPRVSIGHWPPGWYLLEAPFFALVRPSPATVALVTTMIGGCNAAIVDWALRRAGHPRAALAAALAYLLLPLTLEQTGYILLDQPLSLVCGICAILWWYAVRKPSLLGYLGFALAAVMAVMIKGNGVIVAAMPLIHVALTRRWHLLADWRPWAAAVAGLLLVLPWYWITIQIAKGGFNYAPGWDYAGMALRFALLVLSDNVSPVGIVLALAGLLALVRRPERTDPESDIAAVAGAMLLACLAVFAILPVSLVGRYLMPMLPWLTVLIMLALLRLRRWDNPVARPAAIAAAALMLVHALWQDSRLGAKIDIGAGTIAERIAARPGLWMVDGRATGEGGVIASAAYRDRGALGSWTLRASQWLSESDFMGRGYRPLITDPARARALLDRLGVVGIVSIREHHKPAFPHSDLLMRAAEAGFTIEKHAFLRGDGAYLIAVRRDPIVQHPERLNTRSRNVRTLSATIG